MTGIEDSDIRHARALELTLYPHYTHTYSNAHACAHTHTFTRMHAHTRAHSHMHTRMHAPLYAHKHTCCSIHISYASHIHTHMHRLGERVRTLARIRSHTRTNTHLHTWVTYMSTRSEFLPTHTARHTCTHVHVYTRMHAPLRAHEHACLLCVSIHAHTQAWRETEHAR